MTLMDLEAILVATALAGVFGSILWLVRSKRWRVSALVLTFFFLAAGAWTISYLRLPPLAEHQITYRPIATGEGRGHQADDEGYVSSEACRACHPSEYASWHGSYHRRMTQVASSQSVLGSFDDVTLDYHGRPYHLQRDGELFWFTTEINNPQVPQAPPTSIRRPVVLTTGSHHHQAYWYATGEGRAVEFFPFIYLIPEARWVPRESVFLQPTVPPHAPLRQLGALETWQKNRQWNHACIHCHTTRGQPRFERSEHGVPAVDTRVAEFGIACEACHGPGGEHVAANQNPIRRFRHHLSARGDETITNPISLKGRLDSQVCGACHGVSHPKDSQQFRSDLITGRDFRPGDALEETRVLCRGDMDPEVLKRDCPSVQPDQRFWSDGMVRVSGREYTSLLDSPCYQRGELSCFSCHVLHPPGDDPRPTSEWANDQLKHGMDTNQACVQCHQTFNETAALTAHTRHAPSSSGSECYNCHMPFTSYGLLKAVRSHEIHNPSVQASLDTGRPNGCNQCHLDKTLGWTAEHLETWYGQPRPEMNAIEQSVPASLVWLLSGDAGQRALMAWTLGWDAARQTSGEAWLTPWLAQLLVDPYDAVRLIASRSLHRQPIFETLEGFEAIEYDYLAPPKQRQAAARRVRQLWAEQAVPAGQVWDAAALLDDPRGVLPNDIFALLLAQRDDRVVMLAE